MIYISVLTVALIFAFVDLTNISRNFKKIMLVFISLILIFVAGFRYMTGGDYLSYVNIYLNSPSIIDIEFSDVFNAQIEPGFVLIVSLLKLFSSNPQTIFIVISLIHLALLYHIYSKHSEYFLVSMSLFTLNYYLLLTMGQLRQGIAYFIAMIALLKAYERNKKAFIILTVIALSFHTSALVLIPIYFVCNKRFSKKQIFIVLSLSFVAAYGFGVLETILSNNYQLGVLSKYLAYYSQISHYTKGSIPFVGIGYRFVNLFIMLYFRDTVIKNDKRYNFLFNMYFYGVVLFIGLGEVTLISNRISRYFSVFETLIYPYILYRVKPSKKMLIYLIIFILGSYFFLSTVFIDNPDFFIPYRMR